MEKSDLKLSGISGQPDHETLESARGCFNCFNCTTLDSGSGAGANAGSRLDMRLVGADPLSELVWLPQKGLSLKYADGSFSKEKPCLLWCPEANNIVVSSSTDRATDSTCLINSSTPLNTSEGAKKEIPINFLTGSTGIMQLSISSHEREPAACDQTEKLETIANQSSAPEKEGLQCDQEEDILRSRVGNNYSSIEQIITAGVDDDQNPTKRTEEDDFPAKLEAGTSTKNVHEVAHSLENESKIKSEPVPHGFHCLEKHEQISANDLQSLHGRKGFFMAANSTRSESSGNVKINSPQGNELVAEGKMPPGTDSPSSSRIRRYQLKGKGRALSDGIPDGSSSHESVESCNIAGLYSAGKKQFHFEQQTLIVGSKRSKRHIQDSPGSSSLIRKDSSFMNWISNMMKGLSSYRERSVPSLALTLVDPDDHHRVPEHLVGLDKKKGSAGFQTFFDALHRPKRKAHEILSLNPADQAEECRAMELNDKVSNVHTSPRTGHAETGTFHKLFKLPNSQSNECALQNGAGQAFQARGSSKKFSGARHDIGITASMGNKGSMNLGTEKGKDGTISYLSHDKGEGRLGKKNNFELPFDGKANRSYGWEGGPMTSLWITRFTPKVHVPLSDHDACNHTPGKAPTCPTDGVTVKYSTNQFSSSNSGKELQHSGNSSAASPRAQTRGIDARNCVGLSKEQVFPVDKSVHQPDRIFSSPRIKQSEALKHIEPSDANQAVLLAPRHPLDLGASSASPSKLKFKKGDDCGRRLLNGCDCHSQAANAPSTCDGNGPPKGKDVIRRQNEPVSSQHENTKLFDGGIPSSSMGGRSSTRSFTPLVSLLDKHLSDDPKSIFDTVRKLQLSRVNVLKWMHSHMPLSCLNGLFLRLRLGKWDAGLGRARYQVACITGVQKERVPQNPKFSISVDVGGISCLVETRYISNQDFLEDELIAWWTSTSNGGGKIPSREDLRLKLEEKKMLGL